MNNKNQNINSMVSAIICTYNQEDTISQTIESVLSQQCNFPYEIIIGEDYGTDRTRSICIDYQKKYPEIIKLVLFENNMGVVHNWLGCIKEARGKYITTCAGDDYWHNPNKLQLQVDYMENTPECGVLHTDYDELKTGTTRIKNAVKTSRKEVILQGYRQKEIFNGTLRIAALTACIRKELFDKYIPVNEYIDLNFTIEDWPTWVILSRYSKINYLPVSTATYRLGHESLSNQKSYDKVILRFEREKIMYKYLCTLFPEDLPFDEKGYDFYINSILLSLAYEKCDFKSAIQYSSLLRIKGKNNIKIKSARNVLFFYSLWFLLKVKSLIINH